MLSTGKIAVPNVSLPKGGGAVKGIGETFQPNAFSGTGTFSIPIPTTPCRGFEPQLSLDYSSGSGNSIFGIGFGLAIPNISRKTETGFPEYKKTDTFLISNADDLVPKLIEKNGKWEQEEADSRTENGETYSISQYRPRTEGLFARIEKWVSAADADIHWRVTTKDNVTSIYGKDRGWNSRIGVRKKTNDPKDKPRVFQWLLEETRDANGNRISYEYQPEDIQGLEKGARTENPPSVANRYIHKMKYGNYPAGKNEGWHFELVFDYGERPVGKPDQLTYETRGAWPLRTDCFSSYRAGFEIRTQRLCRHILLFHRFGDDVPFLVHGTHLTYTETPCLSLLSKVTQVGYRKDNGVIHSKAMPPLELKYSEAEHGPGFKPLSCVSANGDNGDLHHHIDELVDLYSDGLPGILHSDDQTTLYSRPQGDGNYAAATEPLHFPIFRNLEGGQYALLDLGGDGELDLMAQTPTGSGYFQSDPKKETWEPYQAFSAYPTDAFSEGRQMVDVTGDGFADLVMFESKAVKIYRSRGKDGFAPAIVQPRKDDDLPLTCQGSAVEHVGFADLIGDGGNHLVRIRSGSVECWPHLGYGRFGNKVALDNAPDFGGQLDPSRLFLTDIDGSGTTDLVYACHDHLDIYHNQSGNGFASTPESLPLPQGYDNLDHIRFADVLGNGTACLILTSRDSDLRLRHQYFDFNAAGKPHLLTGIDNHMGAEKKIRYAASTRYYLDDLKASRPWASRLSFPVQVIDSVEVIDHIAGSRLVTRYAYHDGYYDREEREFRGFGYVEQWDTESFEEHRKWIKSHKEKGSSALPLGVDEDPASYVAPVYTRSWYHTGASVNKPGPLSNHYQGHYYDKNPDSGHLPDSALDQATFDPHPGTRGEAYRALHGHKLREEIYGLDHKRNPDLVKHPYAVTESNFKIHLLQPMGDQQHAVCFVHPSEEISWHYERNPKDPRVEHSFTTKVDDYGQVLESCHVFYPRRNEPIPQQHEQAALKVIATRNRFINVDACEDESLRCYLLGVPCEEKEYEIGGLQLDGHRLVNASQIATHLQKALRNEVPFEQTVTGQDLQARLLSLERHFYWNQALDKQLDFGAAAGHALHHHSDTAVFSRDAMVDVFAEKVSAENLTRMLAEAGYGLKEDGYWWNSGLAQHYRGHEDFYLPNRTVDPFDNCTHVTYDKYNLVPVTVIDALGNKAQSEIDYHRLQPRCITDINDNKSEALFDPLGMVIATSVYGTEGDQARGDDPLWERVGDDADDNPPSAFRQTQSSDIGQLRAYGETSATLSEIVRDPGAFLQNATSYFYYVLEYEGKQPPHTVSLMREQHVRNPQTSDGAYTSAPGVSSIQVHIAYSDGFGRALQSKVKAAEGMAFLRDERGVLRRDPEWNLLSGKVDPRWLTSGRTLFNNKGKPVKQYEPFYSAIPNYEPERELTEYGVTHVTHYEPLGRVVRVDTPDGFFSKVEFTPWEETHFDENDTIRESLFFVGNNGKPGLESAVQDALSKAELHHNTPETHVLDNQGRPFLIIHKNEGTVPRKAFCEPEQLVANETESEALWLELKAKGFLDFRAALTSAFQPEQAGFKLGLNKRNAEQETEIIKRLSQIQAEGALLFTRHELDIQGHELSNTDPRLYRRNEREKTSHRNFRHKYDMHGAVLWTWSADAGERWALHNAVGSPVHTWDNRNFHISTHHDALHRPVEVRVKGNDRQGLVLDNVVEKMRYGEGQVDDKKHNLRGKLICHYDQAGVVVFDGYDIKGEPIKTTRRLRKGYKQEANWPESGEEELLDGEGFEANWIHDALGRVIREAHPDGSISTPQYHPEGWLKQVDVTLAASDEKESTPFVREIRYNEKGQKTRIEYGSGVTKKSDKGVTTNYTYDHKTLRLSCLKTTSNGDEGKVLQDIHYNYDPAGNVTQINDLSHKTVFANQGEVKAICEYTYDALYQLTTATGREHPALAGNEYHPANKDSFRHSLFLNLNDSLQLQHYTERYDYDVAGNLTQIKHHSSRAWTRNLLVAETSNQAALRDGVAAGASVAKSHDAHGNVKTLQTVRGNIRWSYRNNIAGVDLIRREEQMFDAEYYVYDSAGQRIRKVSETLISDGIVEIAETIYLGSVEIKRVKTRKKGATKTKGNSTQEPDVLKTNSERWSLHISEGHERIAIAHHWTIGHKKGTQQIRYQLGNHLGSASLELTRNAEIISYEEYLPYGGSAFIAGENQIEVRRKTYRYSGKERDDSTGLYYYGARYYAPWLGRWMSPDPAGTVDGLNLYAFVSGNPIRFVDPSGLCKKVKQKSRSDVHHAGNGNRPKVGRREAPEKPHIGTEAASTAASRSALKPVKRRKTKQIKPKLPKKEIFKIKAEATLPETVSEQLNVEVGKGDFDNNSRKEGSKKRDDISDPSSAMSKIMRQKHAERPRRFFKLDLEAAGKEIDYGMALNSTEAPGTDNSAMIENAVQQHDKILAKVPRDPRSPVLARELLKMHMDEKAAMVKHTQSKLATVGNEVSKPDVSVGSNEAMEGALEQVLAAPSLLSYL